MESFFVVQDIGRFAIKQDKRFEEGARAFSALIGNADKLGVKWSLSYGRCMVDVQSFMEWDIDIHHLTVSHNTRGQYWQLGRKSVELLLQYQLYLLRQKNRELKRKAG